MLDVDMDVIFRLAGANRLPATLNGMAVQSVTCWRQGSFTIVKVVVKSPSGDSRELMGVSKRDCDSDTVDVPLRGREIALARALKGEAVEEV